MIHRVAPNTFPLTRSHEARQAERSRGMAVKGHFFFNGRCFQTYNEVNFGRLVIGDK